MGHNPSVMSTLLVNWQIDGIMQVKIIPSINIMYNNLFKNAVYH
jgi:hypothetical protein